MYAYVLESWRGFFEGVCVPSYVTAYFRDPLPASYLADRSAQYRTVGGPDYNRSARTIRRFSKVGIGVHVWSVRMSLPLTCPVTHRSVGSARNVSLTR
jgi:hypothetical protein